MKFVRCPHCECVFRLPNWIAKMTRNQATRNQDTLWRVLNRANKHQPTKNKPPKTNHKKGG